MQQDHYLYSREHPANLDSLAYTLATRREHLPTRGFCITDGADICTFSEPFKVQLGLRTLFVFTGQGAQWAQMGKELLATYPDFLRDIKEMDKILQKQEQSPAWTLEEELLKPADSSLLNEAEYSQPVCTALQIALVNLLKTWNVIPSGVIGHSSGEIAAAFAAGAITMEEAIIIAYYRGVVSKRHTHPGGMAVVGLGRIEVSKWLISGVTIACENSSSNVTISGDVEPLQVVLETIKSERPEVFQRRLHVEKAYHSRTSIIARIHSSHTDISLDHMHEVGDAYHDLIDKHIQPKKPTVPFFSSVTAKVQQDSYHFGARYWQSNLENPVLFYQACKSALSWARDSDCIHVEIGPHSGLAGPLRQIYVEHKPSNPYVSVLTRGANSVASFLACVGELHCRGLNITYPISHECQVLKDLPTYPWNYQDSYWNETRVMKNSRLPRFPSHDLLGMRTIESSDLEPAWRNVLRLRNVSWLRDHCIGSDIVFPASGYIALVGEAVRQLTDFNDFTVRDMSIKTAMVLDLQQPIEVITNLRPYRLTDSLDSDFFEFSIQTHNGTTFTKHCTGLVGGGRVSRGPDPVMKTFPRVVDERRWYKTMANVGLRYGPRFTGLEEVSAGATESAVSASICERRDPTESPYAMHPTSMDLVLQSCVVAAFKGQPRRFRQPVMPTFIEEVYVRGGTTGEKIRLMSSTSTRKANNGGQAHSYGVDTEGQLVYFLKGLRFSPLDSENQVQDERPETAHLVWKPHVDYLDATSLITPSNGTELARMNSVNERIFLLCAIEAANSIEDIAPAPEHLEKYRTWLLQQVCRAKQSGNPFVSDTHELSLLDSTKRQELIESTLQENIATSMASTTQGIVRCYKHMQSIFKSDIDPLELMQRDDLLASFYDCLQDRHEYKPFLQLLGHLHPQMKVLEIGAGTGGLTAKVLAFLQSEWGDHLYHEYTYTDISAGFFVKAKERFQNYASIKYDVLDITRDPKEQGFPTGHYDLIIASNVLHATPNLQESLLHVRSLLKPDGRLLLQELCAESKWVNFVFGLFPGWWLGAEDGRVDEPYVTPEEWDRRLREAGFAGIDAVALDAERQCQVNAMMITRPTDPDYDTSGVRITLLSIGSTHPAALDVESQLIAIGYGVDHVNWGQEMPEDQDIISFIDIESAFFDDIPGDRLRDFLETVEKHSLSNIIWLTQPAQISPRDPRFAQALGMARTLRSELGLSFTTIEMQDLGPGSSKAICDILQRVQKESEGEVNTDFDPDYEYVWSDRTIQIGRMHWFAVPQALTDTVEAGSSRTLDIGRRGLLHTLRWVAQPLLELPSDEVRIKIQSVGLNFRDLVGAMGVVDGQEEQGRATLGIDSAGVITAVGREVTELKAGDRVMVFSPSRSSLATDLQIPSRLCAKIPGSLSAGEACTMPTVYVTVLRALRDKANIQRGQTLLVHSAAGGVGIAALYYAQWIGAEIYTTVSSEEKASFLAKSFGIPRENIFHSRDSSFVDQILASTRGRGVDVVLNSLSGELLHASWRCVAADGCMVEIGKRDIVGRGRLAMDPFLANRSFIGVDVATIPTTNIDTVKKLLNTTIELYENGVFQPIQPITRFEADHVEDALRYLQRGKHIGKVVVNFPEKLELPLAPTVPAFALRSDKTYLLVGGMGGIGMAIARWMVEHGAKHLAFLSRSAGQKEADKALVAELAEMGCNVMTFAGDVCDSSIVRHIVSTATAPIAGVLQLAMVLADTGVLMMDIDKWNTAVQPKVQGTWNLHNILPADLDFFVMASSLSGICGYWGQSNYAAGNTFLDAFAQYRRGLEMAASTIDLGAVGEVGFVSRNAKVREKVQTMLSTLVSEQSLLDCVQLAILRSQPVTGISTNISTKGYYNSSQLLHGLVFDASNDSMMIWKRDPRMALSRSLEATRATSSKEKSTGDDGLKAFLMTVQDSPRILDQPSSAVTLAREISRRVSIFMMRGDDDQVDLKLSLPAFGVDSLISIEIRNWWRQTLGVDVSVLQLISGGSFADLGKKAVEQLREKYSGK
jgi:acyl transferase domain-containing protein/NADPH:quinone reductase-like Zn-dependent oxidoreductase/SAM-dependent methyltransferase